MIPQGSIILNKTQILKKTLEVNDARYDFLLIQKKLFV